jgi:hypothetical protein
LEDRMPRRALHTDDIQIEQKSAISDNPAAYVGDIVKAEKMPSKEHLAELAFNEEPVTIRLEPTAEKNAATTFPVWVNGRGCEIFQNGRWLEIAYIPIGQVVIIKRKYLAVIIGAKIDTIQTTKTETEDVRPDRENNKILRFTSAVHSLSIIEDRNPKGVEWLTELRRRNF